MRLPWSRGIRAQAGGEESAAGGSGYTDALIAAIQGLAAGATTADAKATAALEACAGLYAASFARAEVQPALPALDPACMAQIARGLIRKGEWLAVIDTTAAAGLRLLPAGTWSITGGPDAREWIVRAELHGPSGTRTVAAPWAGCVHCRYAVDPARPWSGIGPLQWAYTTGQLAGRLENSLALESNATPAQLLPVPEGTNRGDGKDRLDSVKGDIKANPGRSIMVETLIRGGGQGMGAAPASDWKQQRIGADWPAVLRETRRDLVESVALACNVPLPLISARAEGTAGREGLRRFAHTALEPLGDMVAAELAAKLETDVRIDFGRLFASDLAGRARAVKALVEAGVDLGAAINLAGLGDE